MSEMCDSSTATCAGVMGRPSSISARASAAQSFLQV